MSVLNNEYKLLFPTYKVVSSTHSIYL